MSPGDDTPNITVLEILKECPAFKGADESFYSLVKDHSILIRLNPGEKLFELKEDSKGMVYIVISGTIIANSSLASASSFKLKEYYPGDIINLMSFFKDDSDIDEAFAGDSSLVLCINAYMLNQVQEFNNFHRSLLHNITDYFSSRLTHAEKVLNKTSDIATYAIEQRLEESKIRIAFGVFLIEALILMCLYTLTLKMIEPLSRTFIFSAGILIVITGFLVFFMKYSGLPLRDFGLTTKNWKCSILEGSIATIILLIIVLLLKYALIRYLQIPDMPLINPDFGINLSGEITSPMLFYSAIVYLLFVPVQEFVVRGVLQSSIYRFITGTHFFKEWVSIFISNFMFFTFHLHVSISFAFASFLSGMVWGWLYTRNRTLIGVVFSHFVVGFVTIFVINIEGLFRLIGLPSLFSH